MVGAMLCTLPTATLQAGRLTQTWNDGWRFSPCPGDTVAVQLPHTWNLDAYSTAHYYRGDAWYLKSFRMDSAQVAGRQLYLKFDAANSLADVYLNGTRLTTHSGGYTAFIVDITPYLRPGVENLLRVRVNNENKDIPPLAGDFTIFGGIYRDVWLISTSRQHLHLTDAASPGIYIDTPAIDSTQAQVRIRGAVKNDGPRAMKGKLRISLCDATGKVVAKAEERLHIPTGADSIAFSRTFRVERPHLWSPADPYLYKVRVSLTDADGKTEDDAVSLPCGLRWMSADATQGFLLNGKPLKLIGVSCHQDQYPMGIALTDEMHRRDMRLIKEMGANFVRLAHYPQDEAVLRACDELGLLVWEEVPVVNRVELNDTFRANSQSALREMIRQHYNHPSIAFWGFMNEVLMQLPQGVKGSKAVEYHEQLINQARLLHETLKAEDHYRLSTMACAESQLYNRLGLTNLTDVVGWNLYMGWYGNRFDDFEKFVDEEHRKYPVRPLIISEFGAGSDRRLQSLHPERFDFSMQWQQAYLEHYLPVILQRPFLIGAAVWNFIDFSSASRQESMPHINNKGLVDNQRHPKDVYYYLQALLRADRPVLHIAVSDWPVRTLVTDGSPVPQPIKVYTNLPDVALALDGHSLGHLRPEGCHAEWNAPLHAGRNELKVTGTYQGQSVEQTTYIEVVYVPEHITPANVRGLELAVNVGSNCYFTDPASQLCWLPDRPYTPGSWGYTGGEPLTRSGHIGTTPQIIGTANDPLLQTARDGIRQYRFDLPNGSYELELLFADISATKTDNPNTLNVGVNDEPWLLHFCPATEAGRHTLVARKRMVEVTDGKLEVSFEATTGQTYLNTIKVLRIDP
jgi:beta-galactosidase